MKKLHLWAAGLPLVLATLLLGAGCGKKSEPSGTQPQTAGGGGTGSGTGQKAHDHHKGPNDGVIVEWGEEEYHLEFLPNHKTKEAKVWVYGPDHEKLKPVGIKAKDDEITLSITDPKMTVKLKAANKDAAGKASLFVGQHESLAVEKEYKGTISGLVEGTQYTGKFEEKPHKHPK